MEFRFEFHGSAYVALAFPATVGEKTYRRLLKLLLGGRLKPGEYLRQEQLAKQLSVSINTLRGALLLLERDGLVESIPRWGVRVTKLSREKVLAEFELRTALECEAARLCAERATDDELEQIAKFAAAADAAAEHGRARGQDEVSADYEMHQLILGAGRSRRLHSVWKRLHVLHKLVWVDHLQEALSVNGLPGANKRLAEALKSRDPEVAYAAMREHLTRTRDIYLSCVERASREEEEPEEAWAKEAFA